MSSLRPTPQTTPDASGSKPDDAALLRWQRRLLPFMTRSIVAMAVAFFLFSALHLYHVTRFIDAPQGQNIRDQIASEIAKPTSDRPAASDVFQHSLLLLEADALNKRYRQASALLLSRIWSRQLAFVTGMVLAFLGAVFILGKMSESAPTQIAGEATNWKVALSSASPGIILSFFGTALLMTSLLVRTTLDVADGPAYLTVLPTPNTAADVKAPAKAGSAADSAPLSLGAISRIEQAQRAK